ncbi:S8 family peptidase [Gulosibacter macacae]|uniref:S8 family peptidase n=1 Tax=Gulosibacter macacae TaxID=2488791 RepID=UPI001BE0047A|nr:S8/S53 family peptidase [Gulosibacter macacae]
MSLLVAGGLVAGHGPVAPGAAHAQEYAPGPQPPGLVAGDPVGWYIGEYGYDQLHAQGIDGAGVTIAIAEQAFDPNSPDLVGADVTYIPLPEECSYLNEFVSDETISHGNNVAATIVGQGGPGQILGVAPKAKLLVYQLQTINLGDHRWQDGPCDDVLPTSSQRFVEAQVAGADIMSLSVLSSGEPDAWNMALMMMREKAYFRGGGNWGEVFGAEAVPMGAGVVTAVGYDGAVLDWAAKGPEVSLAAPGSWIPFRDVTTGEISYTVGTSLATPIAAGTLALGMQKWPDATTHQLTQSMVHNTRGGNPNLTHNEVTGLGIIDPVAFVAADPSQYPDTPAFTQNRGVDDWAVVPELLDGYPSNMSMHNPPWYQQDAGVDPAEIQWLPPGMEDLVGTAPNADYWETAGASPGPSAGASPLPSTGATAADVPAGLILAGLVGVPVVLVGVVVALVVVARRRGRSKEAATGGPPVPHGYAHPGGVPPQPGGFQQYPYPQQATPQQQAPPNSGAPPVPPGSGPWPLQHPGPGPQSGPPQDPQD